MAYTFPLAIATFSDTIDVSAGDFKLSDSRRFSITADGQVYDTPGGDRRWEGSITLVDAKEPASVDAFLALLTTPGASFLLYDHRRKYPKLDPIGTILGSATVTVLAVQVNNKELSIAGLPSGYTLSRGDHLSFTYVDAAGKTQYSLHQIVSTTAVANGSGNTGTFEVVPHMPRSVTIVGRPVTLIKAPCKVVLRPNKVDYSRGRPGVMSDGQSFEFVQTKV